MALKIYNYLTRKMGLLRPFNREYVSIYGVGQQFAGQRNQPHN
jgi:hypothetical protein